MSIKKVVASSALAVMATGVAVVGLALPAQAVGGNCSSVVQEKEDPFANKFRVRAICSSLQADSKARGTLIINGSGDKHTSWFTAINTYRYSDYTDLYGWEVGGSRVEIEHV
jgi:hypothetical protein